MSYKHIVGIHFGSAVFQIVDDGRIKRVPVKVGIRGSRNIEIIGDVSKGTSVLSPARTDLADGARIRIDNSLTRAMEPAAVSEPTDQPGATPEATVVAAATTAPTDPDDAVISAKRIDMAPDGMAEMATKIDQLPSTEPGVYRFKANLSMEGRWQLSLGAKVQDETGTVQSKLVLKATP